MTRQHIPLSPVTLTITGEQAYVRSARIGRNLGAFSVMLFLIALAFHSFGAADTPSFLPLGICFGPWIGHNCHAVFRTRF